MFESTLSFWGGRSSYIKIDMSLCKRDSQFTYRITYDIFTFKVWFEGDFHRSVVGVLCCAVGFCGETDEQRIKAF